MLSATVLAIFFVPMFFVVVLRLFGHGGDKDHPSANRDIEPDGGNRSSDGGAPVPQGA